MEEHPTHLGVTKFAVSHNLGVTIIYIQLDSQRHAHIVEVMC